MAFSFCLVRSPNKHTGKNINDSKYNASALLAMVALLAIKSSAQTRIHNVILLIDTPTMLDTTMLIP